MADVTINYKGSTIAEISGADSKVLNTSGTYLEGDIEVNYAPRSRTYEITLAKASGWVLLTTLDADVLEHINDASIVVSLTNISGFAFEKYARAMAIASNTPVGMQGSYPIYGMAITQNSETVGNAQAVFYPVNNTSTSDGLGGHASFRISGSNYYVKPYDGFIRSGTYRLTFAW